MPARLVALDEGSDIPLDRSMVVVGRHPLCDVRLDSLRISRHHCCMTQDKDEVVVRDLGSTNGIRINGERVERGRLRPGDELSIAHIRYRLENGVAQEMTLADPNGSLLNGVHRRPGRPAGGRARGRPAGQAAGRGRPERPRGRARPVPDPGHRADEERPGFRRRVLRTGPERGPSDSGVRMSAQLVPINAGSAPAVPISTPGDPDRPPSRCDVRIDSPQVSRRHCCLAIAYDRLVIRDLGSRNGVRVNGRLVEEVQLLGRATRSRSPSSSTGSNRSNPGPGRADRAATPAPAAGPARRDRPRRRLHPAATTDADRRVIGMRFASIICSLSDRGPRPRGTRHRASWRDRRPRSGSSPGSASTVAKETTHHDLEASG